MDSVGTQNGKPKNAIAPIRASRLLIWFSKLFGIYFVLIGTGKRRWIPMRAFWVGDIVVHRAIRVEGVAWVVSHASGISFAGFGFSNRVDAVFAAGRFWDSLDGWDRDWLAGRYDDPYCTSRKSTLKKYRELVLSESDVEFTEPIEP